MGHNTSQLDDGFACGLLQHTLVALRIPHAAMSNSYVLVWESMLGGEG